MRQRFLVIWAVRGALGVIAGCVLTLALALGWVGVWAATASWDNMTAPGQSSTMLLVGPQSLHIEVVAGVCMVGSLALLVAASGLGWLGCHLRTSP